MRSAQRITHRTKQKNLREPWKHGSPHSRNYDLSSLELKFVKLSVESAKFHKLVVVALLNDLSVFDHEDHVCFTNSGEAMRDDYRSVIFHQAVDGFEDKFF